MKAHWNRWFVVDRLKLLAEVDAYREQHGLSSNGFAKLAEVNPGIISRIRHNYSSIALGDFQRICHAAGELDPNDYTMTPEEVE